MVPESSYTELELMQARVVFVPAGWAFCTVRDAFGIRNNFRKPISEEERAKIPGPYPYFGPTKIQDYIGSYEQDGKYALIGEDGDHFLKYRDQPMTQLVEGKCTVNNHAHIIEGSNIASREWFYHYFMHRDIFSFLSRQGAGRYKLNKASLEKIPVLIPPLPEQKKIAQILSTWDQAITATERLLENSQQRKKGLMQQLLTGKKRLPGFEGEWEEGRLKDITAISKGKALSSKDLEDGVFPVVAGGKTSPYTHKTYTHDHAITVSASGAYAGYVAYHEYKFWASDCSVVEATHRSVIEFLYHLMAWNQNKIYALQSGGAQPHVYPKDLHALPVLIPPKSEQKAIAGVLTVAGREIGMLKSKIDFLRSEKKALMQQLLTGKRRVQVDTEAA